MKKIALLVIMLTGISCFSQTNYQLKVKVSENMPAIEYIVDIHRSSQNTKIYFSTYTGIQKYSKTDKNRIEELRLKKKRTASDNKELMNLNNNSKVFTKECYDYSANDSIIKISDSIIQSKEDILSEIEKNKNRVVLDGINLEVTVKNNSEYSYYIHAPDKKHYKLFAQFLVESLNDFKKVQNIN
ncbi:hypothetical protein BC962_3065 [Gillisia mitskevichiae]|uniref:Uncharacterized protein n=1 Tax=Gillisia mitskevichiae TaxID=270921 RepID=A0A495P044_9FLAO|nr:hypothetical protein [Gillisia mitskevichiae]RKS42778.1 hypothetical protein BC962_3065 [Gillisia mitskevichiae]